MLIDPGPVGDGPYPHWSVALATPISSSLAPPTEPRLPPLSLRLVHPLSLRRRETAEHDSTLSRRGFIYSHKMEDITPTSSRRTAVTP